MQEPDRLNVTILLFCLVCIVLLIFQLTRSAVYASETTSPPALELEGGDEGPPDDQPPDTTGDHTEESGTEPEVDLIDIYKPVAPYAPPAYTPGLYSGEDYIEALRVMIANQHVLSAQLTELSVSVNNNLIDARNEAKEQNAVLMQLQRDVVLKFTVFLTLTAAFLILYVLYKVIDFFIL